MEFSVAKYFSANSFIKRNSEVISITEKHASRNSDLLHNNISFSHGTNSEFSESQRVSEENAREFSFPFSNILDDCEATKTIISCLQLHSTLG